MSCQIFSFVFLSVKGWLFILDKGLIAVASIVRTTLKLSHNGTYRGYCQ